MNRKVVDLVLILSFSLMILTSCSSGTVGVIGGSDGPTSIYVSKKVEDKSIAELNAINAIRNENSKKYLGQFEFGAQGCEILYNDNKEDILTVYALATFGGYSFENSVFSRVVGEDAHLVSVSFSRNGAGEFVLEKYLSNVTNYPKEVEEKLSHNNTYNLIEQEVLEAKEYLKKIGKDAEIETKYGTAFERKDPINNTFIAQKLMEQFEKYPVFEGTKEYLEGGKRVVYEKRFKDNIVTYLKKDALQDVIVEETNVKIENGSFEILG